MDIGGSPGGRPREPPGDAGSREPGSSRDRWIENRLSVCRLLTEKRQPRTPDPYPFLKGFPVPYPLPHGIEPGAPGSRSRDGAPGGHRRGRSAGAGAPGGSFRGKCPGARWSPGAQEPGYRHATPPGACRDGGRTAYRRPRSRDRSRFPPGLGDTAGIGAAVDREPGAQEPPGSAGACSNVSPRDCRQSAQLGGNRDRQMSETETSSRAWCALRDRRTAPGIAPREP